MKKLFLIIFFTAAIFLALSGNGKWTDNPYVKSVYALIEEKKDVLYSNMGQFVDSKREQYREKINEQLDSMEARIDQFKADLRERILGRQDKTQARASIYTN